MTLHEQAVQSLRRRIGVALVFKQALLYLTVWAFLWGTAVVILRSALLMSPVLLLWGLAIVPGLGALAAWRALRRLPSTSTVRAALDKASGCGGLLMAAEEQELGRWQDTLGPIGGLRVRWHGGRSLSAFAAGAVFVAVGLLLPERLAALGAGRSLEVGQEVDKLASQIEVLKEEAILEPGRADALKQKLEDLKKEARGEDPAKTLEALDHLQQLASKEAKEAGELALKKNESLTRAEALAEALHKVSGALAEATREEAATELIERLRKKAKKDKKTGRADKHLDAKALKDLHPRTLTRKDLKKLAEALRKSKEDLERMLDRLAKSGLIDPEMLEKAKKLGKYDAEALAALLKERGRKMSLKDMIMICQGGDRARVDGPGGRGGVTEGGDETPLTWKEKSTEEGVKFKEEKLPPSSLAALKESTPIGYSKETPTVNRTGGQSQPGALGHSTTGGGSAQTQVILPRHRGAVQRYFERPTAKE